MLADKTQFVWDPVSRSMFSLPGRKKNLQEKMHEVRESKVGGHDGEAQPNKYPIR